MVSKLSHNDVAGSLKKILEDMADHPDTLKPLDPDLVKRVRELTHGVEVDLEARLSAKDE